MVSAVVLCRPIAMVVFYRGGVVSAVDVPCRPIAMVVFYKGGVVSAVDVICRPIAMVVFYRGGGGLCCSPVQTYSNGGVLYSHHAA